MAKKAKFLTLSEDVINTVSGIAETEFSGNFTAAIESLCNQSALMRSIDERVRHLMYDAAKPEIDHTRARAIVDALHI